ncbi:mitochondrial ribosomal protein MRP51 [Aspergillus pseudoustus]|uniref:Mitochondrial ribosomal protein MRP51 n=1 Tax=Aspergillus pseudoustus TaxID=1810923 RepID=A0ABR4KXS5_9EURO
MFPENQLFFRISKTLPLSSTSMAAVNASPAANLLRKSRLFALPQALNLHPENPTIRVRSESNTATLPHPIRASIITPRSSLLKGDWGLKRPLPALSTSNKSRKPVVRVNAIDTFEHVTDFESAQDHTVTLRKFQELHMPMSLPARANYTQSITTRHESPFETHLDNTATSEGIDKPGARRYRHTGPFLPGLSEADFNTYLKKVQREKPELLRKLRERFATQLNTERRKQAQDNGEELEALAPVQVTDEDFQKYLRVLRSDPGALGLAIFDLLDLPSGLPVPRERFGPDCYQSPGTVLSSPEYSVRGPPSTHPSGGISYTRSHALTYNHPEHGPQVYQRPAEARVLRRKGRFKGASFRAIVGVGGIALEDGEPKTFSDPNAPHGITYFDSAIPGGAKYYVTPYRAMMESDGRIRLAVHRAEPQTRFAYGVQNYQKPEAAATTRSDSSRLRRRPIQRLDRSRTDSLSEPLPLPAEPTEDVARNLMRTLTQR